MMEPFSSLVAIGIQWGGRVCSHIDLAPLWGPPEGKGDAATFIPPPYCGFTTTIGLVPTPASSSVRKALYPKAQLVIKHYGGEAVLSWSQGANVCPHGPCWWVMASAHGKPMTHTNPNDLA